MKLMVDPNFPNHRKVRKLAGALQSDHYKIMGHLLALWCEVMKQRETGELKDWDDLDIAVAAGWTGDASEFVKCLEKIGFIENEGAAFVIHEWLDHQGNFIEKRQGWLDRKRRQRGGKGSEKDDVPKESRGTSDNVTRDIPKSHAGQASPFLSFPFPSSPVLASTKPEEPDSGVDSAVEDGGCAPPPPPAVLDGSSPEGTADPDFPFGGGPQADPTLQVIFDAALKNSNGHQKQIEPSAQDEVIRRLLMLVSGLKSTSTLKVWRMVIEGTRARFGAQAVEEWLSNQQVNIGKSAYDMESELKVLHKGNDLGAKVKLKARNEQRAQARVKVLDGILDFLRNHAPTCEGCKDCERDRGMLLAGGFSKDRIPKAKAPTKEDSK